MCSAFNYKLKFSFYFSAFDFSQRKLEITGHDCEIQSRSDFVLELDVSCSARQIIKLLIQEVSSAAIMEAFDSLIFHDFKAFFEVS